MGDVHGDFSNMIKLLEKVGAINEYERVEGWRLIQLGDLIHGGDTQTNDEITLNFALKIFDDLLIGNHDAPVYFPLARFTKFYGMKECSAGLRALITANKDRFKAATSVGEYLITHAGLHSGLSKGWRDQDVETIVSIINNRFRNKCLTSQSDDLFDAVDAERGGSDKYGGILWCDWARLKNTRGYKYQVVGHTPQKNPVQFRNMWNIDVGAGLSHKVAAVIYEDGKWTSVQV